MRRDKFRAYDIAISRGIPYDLVDLIHKISSFLKIYSNNNCQSILHNPYVLSAILLYFSLKS